MKLDPIDPARAGNAMPTPRPKRRTARPARKTYQFRFSGDEIEELDFKAEEAGLDRSKFLRRAIRQTMVMNNDTARHQTFLLSNLANNMNQIAHVANTFKGDADALTIVQQLRRIDLRLRRAFHLSDVPLLKPENYRQGDRS